jgi:hypothetical protein
MITMSSTLTRLGFLSFAVSLSTGCSLSVDFGEGWNVGVVNGNGIPTSERREVEPFEKIAVHGAIEIEMENGDEPSLEVSTDENLMPIIETKVRNGELSIRSTQSYSGSVKVKAVVRSLTGYEGTGATKGVLANPNTEAFHVELSGASSLQCGEGELQKLAVDASGVSKFSAPRLSAIAVQAEASGASSIQVLAVERLDAHASGASTIEYGGSPKVSKSTSGASSVKKSD